MNTLTIQNIVSKNDYQTLLNHYLNPVSSYYDGNGSRILFPDYYATSYNDCIQGIESFSRPLWGYIYGDCPNNIVNNILSMIWEGTNPVSSNYWGRITDYSQTIVELVPIIFFCYKHREKIYKRNNVLMENIERWFWQINEVKVSENNWLFFPILINMFLKCMGLKYSSQTIDECKNKIEKLYLGNGWYSDGPDKQRDYYISFAFHYYALLYSIYSDDLAYKEIAYHRAEEFSKTFITWFADDGAAIPFGRSLTYKFAQSAFWAMMITANVNPNYNSIYKTILNRNLMWWNDKNICNKEGLLTLGYTYPNHVMTEYYNGTGSSYWALKSFVVLLLEEDNDFFSLQQEEEICVERKVLIPEADMLVVRNCGFPYAFVNGQYSKNNFGHTECKYEKFVYSPLFGVSVSKSYNSLELLACDCSLAISVNGNQYFARHDYKSIEISEEKIVSEWKVSPKIRILSVIVPGAPLHLRFHYIESEDTIDVFDGGYSIDASEYHYEISNAVCLASNSFQQSLAFSVIGGGEAMLIDVVPNVNLQFPKTKIPGIKHHLRPGKYIICNAFMGDINKDINIMDFLSSFPQISVKESEFVVGELHFSVDLNTSYKVPNSYLDYLKKLKRYYHKIKSSI